MLREKTEHLEELSTQDIQGIIHELRVHQIELEMQNEDLRRTQEELEGSRKEYTDLYDFAPIGYFTFDKDGLILKANLTGARKLGEERKSLIRQPFLLYVVPEDRMIFYSHLHQALRTGTIQTYELKLVDKKKNQFDAQLESMPVQDAEGEFNQCRTAVIDITERKRAEEALRISEAKYRSIFENVVEGLFHTALDGRFITVNPSLAHIFGYESPQEFLSKLTNVKQLYLDPSRRDELVHLVQTQEVVTGFEAQLRRKDGSIIWVSLNVRALHDSSGRVTSLEGTLLDVTERKRSEELSKAIYNVNIIINSTLDFDEIMRKVVVEAAKAIGSDACNITFCRNSHWEVEYAYGLP